MKLSTFSVGAVFAVAIGVGLWWRQNENAMHQSTPSGRSSPVPDGQTMPESEPIQENSERNIRGNGSVSNRKPSLTSASHDPDPGKLLGDSNDLWRITSKDGKVVDGRRLAISLNDNNYDEVLSELGRHGNDDHQNKVKGVIENQLREISSNAAVSQIGCNEKMCIGSLILQSEEDAKKFLKGMSNFPEADFIKNLTLVVNQSLRGFGRFSLITDPRAESVVETYAPGFQPPPGNLTPDQRRAILQGLQSRTELEATGKAR
jgi:hypothetical protein